MNTIYKRRSCRNYNDKQVKTEDINSIIKAGMNAPSSFNSEPWHFIVVKNKDILTKLSEIKKYALFLKDCDTMIILVSKLGSPFYEQDMAACMQNMMLEATNLELGTCWIGLDKYKGETLLINEMFNIEEGYESFSLLSVGHSDIVKKENNKFDLDKIKYEIWK